jgi:hypothetical protein
MVKHTWTLSWFNSATERLVGETTLDGLSDEVVVKILAVPLDEILAGEFPLDADRAERLHLTTGHHTALDRFEYFLGATAVQQAVEADDPAAGTS